MSTVFPSPQPSPVNLPPDVAGQWADPGEVNALASQYAGGSGTAATVPTLYWGPGKPVPVYGRPRTGRAGSGATTVPGQAVSKTVDEAVMYLRNLKLDDPKEFFRIGDAMVAQGYLKAGYAPEDVEGVWQWAAQKAADYYAGGMGRSVTIAQVLDQWAPSNASNGYSDLAGTGTGAPRLTTYTSTSANVSSRSDIKGAARAVGQQELGRDLTSSELDALVTKVQAAQRQAPTVTTTTQRTNAAGDQQTSHSTTTGGINEQTFITDQLRANPDYAEHQAAAFYLPLLFQALGATTG